jgi:hypothetical protein
MGDADSPLSFEWYREFYVVGVPDVDIRKPRPTSEISTAWSYAGRREWQCYLRQVPRHKVPGRVKSGRARRQAVEPRTDR